MVGLVSSGGLVVGLICWLVGSDIWREPSWPGIGQAEFVGEILWAGSQSASCNSHEAFPFGVMAVITSMWHVGSFACRVVEQKQKGKSLDDSPNYGGRLHNLPNYEKVYIIL